MHIGKRTVSVLGAAAMAATAALAVPATAQAAATARTPVIAIHLGKRTTLNHHGIRAGRVIFNVYSAKGDHSAQLARIHKGYTLARANQDINSGFGGNAAAIRRADHHVTFRGGIDARPGKPGRFATTLTTGRYVIINFDTGAHTFLYVVGKPVNRAPFRQTGAITMLTYGFDSRSVLPHTGAMRLGNISDQPHFLVMQRIKKGVTRKQLMKAFNSNGKPKFVLPGSLDSGVMSPYRTQVFHYSLPAGRYVMACFWPDDDTGMLHAQMGMFKQVTLA